ncbi:Methyltransferase domain protein [Candidatus Megaera venefica]|uniref:Methyltransferase domain protein n=1 Tax=Candidatus Megaera venefica TaxID=2055910 RepID=A0ABU5NEV6_9RICK|nr:Methyltransferase domain protein [Candidatus Megaera venefica]
MIFLGTSIGNLTNEEQKRLLGMIARTLKKGDEFMLGVDLQKDPEVIVKAYKGFSDWNLNYLENMNQKLGANFIRENFTHYPVYDPLTGCIYLYLMSKVD